MMMMMRLISMAAALLCSACHLGDGFRGPGFDQTSGAVKPGVPEMVVVAITTGDVAEGQKSAFLRELEAVMVDLSQRDGLVGFMLQKQASGSRIRTMSAWFDDDSLDRFLDSEAHRHAVKRGGIPRSSVRFTRVMLAASKLPLTWADAIRLLESAQPD